MSSIVEEIKKFKEVQKPEWAYFVKTGAHKERTPVDQDWWFVRAASVLRNVYMKGPIGVNRLSKFYGGRKNRGHRPERKYDGSRNITRKILQQLEASGLVKSVKEPTSGKVVTKKGNDIVKKLRENGRSNN